MVILGIDPGTTSIGYALIRADALPELIEAGMLDVRSHDAAGRLTEIYRGMVALIQKTGPSRAAVERLFFTKNAKTAMAVSEARGVVLLTTALAGILTFEYTPLEVKKTMTGDGKADKEQVKKIIRMSIKGAQTLKARDDVFDAIAVALTCYFKNRLGLVHHT